MTCPYCAASLPDGARLCSACGKLLAPTAPPPGPPAGQGAPPYLGGPQAGAPWTAPTGVPPRWGPGAPPGGPGYGTPYGHTPNVYHALFDPRQLPPETAEAYRQHRLHATFSVFLAIFLHLVTFGFSSWVMIARKHSFLPRILPDDFTFGRGFGFLFIPFFNLYWMFVLLHRTVDRLALQTKLWEAGPAPSRGLATALAILNAIGAIPYLGLVVSVIPLPIVWAFSLAQMQAVCNRLALAAAPASARADMVMLERRMRLRWLGWTLLGPSALVVVATLVTFAGPAGGALEAIIGLTVFLALALGGAAMVYRGSLGTRETYHDLSGIAPQIVAGYLRLDKNAAWTVVWVAGILAALTGGIGLVTVASPQVEGAVEQGWASVGQAVGLVALAGYATYKARELQGQLAWLERATGE
ncbi:MAG: hypothetical protein IT306_00845 [Chloroflexi bacterium]|nr:hypothetical protein [Chloroflexota bacterium]